MDAVPGSNCNFLLCIFAPIEVDLAIGRIGFACLFTSCLLGYCIVKYGVKYTVTNIGGQLALI